MDQYFHIYFLNIIKWRKHSTKHTLTFVLKGRREKTITKFQLKQKRKGWGIAHPKALGSIPSAIKSTSVL